VLVDGKRLRCCRSVTCGETADESIDTPSEKAISSAVSAAPDATDADHPTTPAATTHPPLERLWAIDRLGA